MGNAPFNIAKGRIAAFYRNVDENTPAPSALVVVLLKSSGLETDDVLNNHDTLSALLAATNDECDFTGYVRKVLSSTDLAIPAPDDTNNRIDFDIPDQVWTSAGGAVNNVVGKLLVCYDPDETAGTDVDIIPMTYHDFSITTNGTNLTATVNSAGFFRAS